MKCIRKAHAEKITFWSRDIIIGLIISTIPFDKLHAKYYPHFFVFEAQTGLQITVIAAKIRIIVLLRS